MRALLQRVVDARVDVGDRRVGEIGPGLLVFVGVMKEDGAAEADRLAERLAGFRIFEDEAGKMNRSVLDVGGEVLVVSQFTLCADTRRGSRPSFDPAAPPDRASPLVERLVDRLRSAGLRVATGAFGERMRVSLANDGPVTFWVEVAPSRGA